MDNLRNVLNQAIDAIEGLMKYNYHGKPLDEEDQAGMEAISAIRKTLAELESGPAVVTDDDIRKIYDSFGDPNSVKETPHGRLA